MIPSGNSPTGGDTRVKTITQPGSSNRRQPRVYFSFKRLLWGLFFIISFSGGYFIYKTLYTSYTIAKDPHKSLYQDLTAPFGPGDVVHPLVNANQTFDIVATVWIRKDPAESVTEDSSPRVFRDPSALVEKPIFTETIFRGLRLRDNDVKTAVKFRVPTKIFKNKELYTYDLRGSFVLVLNSPSPFDDVINYSSWIPPFITYPPSISWNGTHSPSVAALLINAYGTFTPLLSFHNVKSKCGSPRNPVEEGNTGDSGGHKQEGIRNHPSDQFNQPFPKKGQPPLLSHPYIITRSFLRVANMTPLYNKDAFEWAHQRLKYNACYMRNAAPNWRWCTRSFHTNGHLESKIWLKRKDSSKDKYPNRLAYAPYLSVADTPVGPLDLVPVPVNREDCSNTNLPGNDANDSDEDFVDVTWNIAFSGRTAEKLDLTDYLPKTGGDYDMTDTESFDLGWRHHEIELMQGMIGQRFHDDYHPRRALFFIAIGRLMEFLQVILGLYYWLSLPSTVGVSVTGNALIAAAGIFDGIFGAIFEASRKGYSSPQFIWAASKHAAFRILSYSTLKGITRTKIYFSKRWLPVVHFAPASHAERISQRLDAQTTWKFKILAFVTFASFFQLCYSQDIYIISRASRGPPIPKAPVLSGIFILHTLTVTPALILGRILQLIMNYRGEVFSGKYRICAILDLLGSLFAVAAAAPPIVGRSIRSWGLDVEKGTELMAVAALAIQAFWYPPVAPADQDGDPARLKDV